GLTLQTIDFASEENLRMAAYVVRGAGHARPSLVVVTAVDTAGWRPWLGAKASAIADHLPGGRAVAADRTAFEAAKQTLAGNDWAFAAVPRRGEGPNQWDP